MAAACDDGVLRIFTAEALEPGLTYARSLPSLGSRLLSVAWHPNGQSLITGTAAGTLHAWDLASGRELLRISVGARPVFPDCQPASLPWHGTHAPACSRKGFSPSCSNLHHLLVCWVMGKRPV